MARFKVVQVLNDGHPVPEWLRGSLASAGVDLDISLCTSREDLARVAADADVVWAYSGNRLLSGTNLAELKRCGAILRTGSGTDNVDVKLATEMGIIVVNTPDAVTDQVADQTISLLFGLVRQIPRHDRLIRRGEWNFRAALPARRFRGATLGLVGFGRIPRAIVRKLSGFDMKFVANDLYVAPELMDSLGVRSASLADLLKTSDYVSVHCPFTPETYHLIGEKALRSMSPHSLLVNTSRGEVVDEDALIRALREGWIAGAGLDVLEKEPPAPDHPLLEMENVILTPHFAGYSDRYPEEFYEASAEAIVDLASGRWPKSVVNPDVKPRWGAMSPRLDHRDPKGR